MEQNYRALQSENYQLREYILNLQSRLLENSSDIPPAPSQVNLNRAPAEASSSAGRRYPDDDMQQGPPPEHRQPDPHDGMSQLQAAAAQAEGVQHQSPYGLGSAPDYKVPRPGPSQEGER